MRSFVVSHEGVRHAFWDNVHVDVLCERCFAKFELGPLFVVNRDMCDGWRDYRTCGTCRLESLHTIINWELSND